MDLQVTQENFSKALNTVARVATGKTTLPILSNILLKIVDNRLSIAATNLDIAITQFIGAKVSKKGSLTIPARLTQDFVSNLPNTTIHISQDEHKLHIKTETYQSTINGVNAEEFPVMPAITDGTTWKLPAQDFKKTLSQVVIAASNDEARPLLTGVYIHNTEKLYIASTDSYRLAEKTLPQLKNKISLLVPANAIQDVIRIIGDNNGDIQITHDEQQVSFAINDIQLTARLIEGNYPDYQKLIPSKFENLATVDRSELINITKVSSLFARENAGSITLKLDAKNNNISVSSIASQLGENSASAPAKIKGAGEVTLNSRYLLEGLQAFDGAKIDVCFNGKLEPIVIRDPDNPGYIHIVMPLKS